MPLEVTGQNACCHTPLSYQSVPIKTSAAVLSGAKASVYTSAVHLFCGVASFYFFKKGKKPTNKAEKQKEERTYRSLRNPKKGEHKYIQIGWILHSIIAMGRPLFLCSAMFLVTF
jgi:hypothetical protein